MKRPSRFILLLCGILIVFTLLIAKTLVIKVKATNLRSEPKFYAQPIALLQNGESVEKIDAQNGWFKVKTSAGMEGWIHSSAVEERKFSLLAIDQHLKTQTSADEVALAAKGFNRKVEEAYKAKNPQISFATVDEMLKIKIPLSQMVIFLKRGKLAEFGREK